MKECPSCGDMVNLRDWDSFAGICTACLLVIESLPWGENA